MAKATNDLLEKLHGKLAEKFLAKLEAGEVTASDMNVIRQFLKDNGIDSADASTGPLKALTDALPFPTAINE